MKNVVLVNETLAMAGNSYSADIVAERYYPLRLCGCGRGYPPRTHSVRKNNLATIRGPGRASSTTILEGDPLYRSCRFEPFRRDHQVQHVKITEANVHVGVSAER